MGSKTDFPASYYGDLGKRNPFVAGFEREMTSFIAHMKQAASHQDNSSYSKGLNLLMEIWKRYKHRLPKKFYQERMLEVADFLFSIKLYQLALWQGYIPCLEQFSPVNIVEVTDVEHFMNCFFPEGFHTNRDTLNMKIRALQGCFLCTFELEKKATFLTVEGMYRLLRMLDFIRIMVQAFQQHEHHHMYLFNGSLHIYNICRYLMTMNYSAQALEYLLWASASFELCVPLMTAKYLPWRATLYCAVCQCYYDNQAAEQAEVFASRALGKISDLAVLEQQSEIPPTIETLRAYKEATVKLTCMVFKQLVYASRVGSTCKSLITTKPTSNLREVHTRSGSTSTDRFLKGLFDGYSAQFQGILEALGDSRRRPLQTGMPPDLDLQAVILELLSAGIKILSGVQNITMRSKAARRIQTENSLTISPSTLTSDHTQMELAARASNNVSFLSAVRFVKMLFHYEQWDIFAALAKQMLEILPADAFRKAELELVLMDRYSNLLLKEERSTNGIESETMMSDEFTILVDTLHKDVCGCSEEVQLDRDLVLDMVLLLWRKIKAAFQETQGQLMGPERHKWAHCLSSLCEVAVVCDLASVDCIVLAEMSLRLALLLESAADCNANTAVMSEDGVNSRSFSTLTGSQGELLQRMCEVLDVGLRGLGKGWNTLLLQDNATGCDSTTLQKPRSTPPSPSSAGIRHGREEKEVRKEVEESEYKGLLSLMAADLHLELVTFYHRASLRLQQLNAAVTEPNLLDRIKKNKLSKALFLSQKALLLHSTKPNSSNETKMLLEEALVLIEKAEAHEKKLSKACSPEEPPASNKDKGDGDYPPPPPVLLLHTNTSLTFVPAPYPMEGQVRWYQLFGRVVDGVNLRVRLGDCSLQGTGLLVPAVPGQCELKVEGLEPNQNYVFALAAYNNQGELLGNSLGEHTMPILASIPLPLLTTWALLAQAAFQTNNCAVARRCCRILWSHFTLANCRPQNSCSLTGLHKQRLQSSSPLLLQLFLTSIFIETEINIQQGALYCDSVRDNGPPIWGQEARLAECERMQVAIDLAMWLNDSGSALQAAVYCYGLLAPLIFHQVVCDPVVQVLLKCLVVLEENAAVLKQKWTGITSESFMHMLACIIYYLYKALNAHRDPHMAALVMDRGRNLLQEVCEAQLVYSRPSSATEPPKMEISTLGGKKKKNPRIRALHKKKKGAAKAGDPTDIEDLISSLPLKSAHRSVMKARHEAGFVMYATFLLQRAMQEGSNDLIIQWAHGIFTYISRRDKNLELTERWEGAEQITAKQKKRFKLHRGMKSDCEAVRTLISCWLHDRKQRLYVRGLFSEERVWRSQLNHIVAHAHLELLHQELGQLLGPAPHHSYRQLDPLAFSLGYSGLLVSWNTLASPEAEGPSRSSRNTPLRSSREQPTSPPRGDTRCEDSTLEGSGEDEEGSLIAGTDPGGPPATRSPVELLESLSKAGLHLRRAMVLAHRGGHWTTLQCVCHTLWEQGCRMAALLERGARLDPPCPISLEQLHDTTAPLLVTAAELLMDMLDRLGLWSVFDGGDEGALEASLDDVTKVDLRWVRTLVLHAMELLHVRAKWETLAHYALLFNCYTRERYSLLVSPLLIHAQRKLLERIALFKGPPVPQPHHVKTQKATGKEITCRNYAGCQLLCALDPPNKPPNLDSPSPRQHNRHRHIKPVLAVQRSLVLVCVPLDVEHTLLCYRQALERSPRCLLAFQHSRSLLLLLLAHTQCSPETQGVQSAGQVRICATVTSAPDPRPCDLTMEDYSTVKALYSLPISPRHIHSVISAYSTSIKRLQAKRQESLAVQALHDLGNLHFYTRNTCAAHSYWCKALDCALRSSDVLEKWDGVSWGGGSPQHTLKQAGMWGCLQAAVLAAKIAQYILTSDISQRTMCCLLSAHLFKCVLCCTLSRPQCDLQYASYSIGDELLPGADLFSEPHRANPGTTVASLKFLCYWLYMAGHYPTLLPMLALYLHFVGTVCRDMQQTVEGKILKMRALTELSLFAEAITEAGQISQGVGVFLPLGSISIDKAQPYKMFYNTRSPMHNAQALEHLVNCSLAPSLPSLYGSVLCRRFDLARAQLLLALTSTMPTLPLSDGGGNAKLGVTENSDRPPDPQQESIDTEGSCSKMKASTRILLDLQKDKLSPAKMKYRLLEGAFHLLTSTSEQHLSHSEPEELELTIEANLLMASLYLQLGRSALSCNMAVASLKLLQTSPVITEHSSPIPDSRAMARSSPQHSRGPHPASIPWSECPRAVEARERTGAPLWLRCRLALLRSLVTHVPGSALLPGADSSQEAARVLKEGLEECVLWGDPDTRALLLLEGAALDARRGQSTEDRISALQEVGALLSGRPHMPPGSSWALARATLLLSDLRGTLSTALLELSQQLLQRQLCAVFSQCVLLEDGEVSLPPPGLSHTYLPHLQLLAQATMRLGYMQALRASRPRQTQRDPKPPESPGLSPGPEVAQALRRAHQVLRSAQALSRSCASPDTQLEIDLLYCCGTVERCLAFSGYLKREEVAQTFLQCIQMSIRHCHNLPVIRKCYLEAALLFLQDWQHTSNKPPAPPPQQKVSKWKCVLSCLNRALASVEGHTIPFWVCLRAAAVVHNARSSCGQLCGAAAAQGGLLSNAALKELPDFITNDLFHPCGGIFQTSRGSVSLTTHSFRDTTNQHPELTWVHMARYYTHLLNLQQQVTTKLVSLQTLEGLSSVSGDVSLALRLSQLHSFFWSHMTHYRENCCSPEPTPTEVMLRPYTPQLRSTKRASAKQVDKPYPWSVSLQPELCVQWYQPDLSPAPEYQDMVILLYGYNERAMSAVSSPASVVTRMHCGIRLIDSESAKAVHAELCEMCVLANMTLSVATDFCCPPSHKAEQHRKSPEPWSQNMQKMKDKILSCCLSIRYLLQPGSTFSPLTEVPFDITLENLYDLERCFNPAGGAIVNQSTLTDWILAFLTDSDTT